MYAGTKVLAIPDGVGYANCFILSAVVRFENVDWTLSRNVAKLLQTLDIQRFPKMLGQGTVTICPRCRCATSTRRNGELGASLAFSIGEMRIVADEVSVEAEIPSV